MLDIEQWRQSIRHRVSQDAGLLAGLTACVAGAVSVTVIIQRERERERDSRSVMARYNNATFGNAYIPRQHFPRSVLVRHARFPRDDVTRMMRGKPLFWNLSLGPPSGPTD